MVFLIAVVALILLGFFWRQAIVGAGVVLIGATTIAALVLVILAGAWLWSFATGKFNPQQQAAVQPGPAATAAASPGTGTALAPAAPTVDVTTKTHETGLDVLAKMMRGVPQTGDDTAVLSVDQRSAIGDHVRACWTYDPKALGVDKMQVLLMVTADAAGVARLAVVAGSDEARLSEPVFREFAERAEQAVLDPRCANLPLPAIMLGRPNVLTFRFAP